MLGFYQVVMWEIRKESLKLLLLPSGYIHVEYQTAGILTA